MGIRDATQYLTELKRMQRDPHLWPDFLTGLPAVGTVVQKLLAAYPRLGTMAITYIRIANVHPYLIKHGPSRHTEIIQWAAAALSTSADKVNGFVGALGTHDFLAVMKKKATPGFLQEATRVFDRRIRSYYSEDELRSGKVLSFRRDGEPIDIGLMSLITATLDHKTEMPAEDIIPYLADLCTQAERKAL